MIKKTELQLQYDFNDYLYEKYKGITIHEKFFYAADILRIVDRYHYERCFSRWLDEQIEKGELEEIDGEFYKKIN